MKLLGKAFIFLVAEMDNILGWLKHPHAGKKNTVIRSYHIILYFELLLPPRDSLQAILSPKTMGV
jgi:hypothetical protein